MTNYLLIVSASSLEKREVFENPPKSEIEILINGIGYLRWREFSGEDDSGYVGFPPRCFLFEDKNKLEEYNNMFNINLYSTLETRLYKNASTKDIDVRPFFSSIGSCAVDLTENDLLIISHNYMLGGDIGNNFSYNKYLPIEEALSMYKQDLQDLFCQDYTSHRDFYKYIQDGIRKRQTISLCVSLETKSGKLVIGEKPRYNLDISKLDKIPEFEVERINPYEVKIRSSKKRVPSLSNKPTREVRNWPGKENKDGFGSIIDYGSTAHFSSEQMPLCKDSLQIDSLIDAAKISPDSTALMVIYSGNSSLGFVGINKILGYNPLMDLSRKGIIQEYRKLLDENLESILETNNLLVGVGIYDCQNLVVHRKLDMAFKDRSQKEGLFYLFEQNIQPPFRL